MVSNLSDEEIRVAALQASIAWFKGCCEPNDEMMMRMPRQVIIETAVRFEGYIRDGQ